MTDELDNTEYTKKMSQSMSELNEKLLNRAQSNTSAKSLTSEVTAKPDSSSLNIDTLNKNIYFD